VAITCTILLQTGSSAPGAASQATASITVVTGNAYFVYCHQVKGVSIDPNYATLTGAGQTWTDILTARHPYTASGTTRRRTQVFWALATSSTSGALTFAGLNTPDTLDWFVVEVTDATGALPYVASNVQLSTGTTVSGVLRETTTMNAPASTDNRWIQFCGQNVNATSMRVEDLAMSGGDADHTDLGSFGSGTTRTRKNMTGWLSTDPTADLTPGFITNGTAIYGHTVLEIAFLAAGASAIKTVAGVARATIKSASMSHPSVISSGSASRAVGGRGPIRPPRGSSAGTCARRQGRRPSRTKSRDPRGGRFRR
jgi:hypothetical protein